MPVPTTTTQFDVAKHIETRTAGSPAPVALPLVQAPVALVYGQNLRDGKVEVPSANQALAGAIPQLCVFVTDLPGLPDRPYIVGRKGDVGDTEFAPQLWPRQDRPAVLITIRGGVRVNAPTKTLADAIQRAVDYSPPPGYSEARAVNPRPRQMPENGTSQDVFIIELRLRRTID